MDAPSVAAPISAQPHAGEPHSGESNSNPSARRSKAWDAKQPRARFAPEYEVLLGRLIALRKARGLTQIEMAKALGKTQSHVSMCENRERELSVIDVWKWCLAAGIKWSEFVKQIEEEVTP